MLRRLLGAAILVVTLAACGEGVTPSAEDVGAGGAGDVTDDPEEAAAFLARSAESTRAVESGRMEVTIESDDGVLPSTTMTGEFADGGQSAHMTVDVGVGETEITVVDGVTYTETAGQCFPIEVPEGVGAASPGAVTDPGPLLDLLGGVGSGVTDEGREEVRGVDTTHFSGSFTLEDALGQVEGDDREAVEGLFGSSAVPDELLETEFPVDVFVDDDGLVRRMEMDLDVSGIEDDGALPGVQIAYDLFDFDADITIERPLGCDDEAPSLDSGPDGPFDPDEFREMCEDLLDDFEGEDGVEPFPDGFDPCALPEDGGTVGS